MDCGFCGGPVVIISEVFWRCIVVYLLGRGTPAAAVSIACIPRAHHMIGTTASAAMRQGSRPNSWFRPVRSVAIAKQLQTGIFFSFLYLKKIKISKIYGGFEKFQNYTPVAPCLATGGLSPSGWATGHKCKKKLHLDPGARDVLNSELVKYI